MFNGWKKRRIAGFTLLMSCFYALSSPAATMLSCHQFQRPELGNPGVMLLIIVAVILFL